MKMLPVQLSLNPPLGLWSDVLWRCPPAPPSQLAELKTQLPASLPSDPRLWGREDVSVFLRFCEREFDLPKVDYDLFQMNGKALCLLTRADFGHRCPGAGDVLHNVLQMLIIESHMMQWHLPNSPVTPTSRYPMSPHSHPPTPTWPPIAPPESPFHNAAAHMHHFMAAPNSVTLSPPPSVDSQASSPPQNQENGGVIQVALNASTVNNNSNSSNSSISNGMSNSNSGSNGSTTNSILSNGYGSNIVVASNSSNNSESDEENYTDVGGVASKNNASAVAVATAAAAAAVAQQYHGSPPTTPILKDMPKNLVKQITNSFVNSWSQGTGSLPLPTSSVSSCSQLPYEQKMQNGNSNSNGSPPTTPTLKDMPKHLVKQITNSFVNSWSAASQVLPPPAAVSSGQLTYEQKMQTGGNSGGASVSPPSTPILKDMPQSLVKQITNSFVNSWSASQGLPQHPSSASQLTYEQKIANGGSVSAPTTPSFMQPVKREFFPENTEPNTNGRLLWDFLQQLLNDRNQKYSDLIAWKCRDTGVFKIVDPAGLAKLWGIQKNHLSMNYDKMSRALRYYYRVNILRKVQGERHCYQFLRNPTELKNIKNISLLRQSAATSNGQATATNQTTSANTNGNSASNSGPGSNWNMNASLQQAAAAAAAVAAAQQSPQRPASRSSSTSSSTTGHMSLPGAAAYGPPPTSPLFMHAINGAAAFHYLSASAGPSPNSPALPSTPSEKFQFNAFKIESNGMTPEHFDEMKPTDLSVDRGSTSGSGTEKRPYSSPSANEDCYPLISNADGLTTIKLIRYNDSEPATKMETSTSPTHSLENQQQHHHNLHHPQQRDGTSSPPSDERSTPTPMHTDSDCNSSEPDGQQYASMPTDLRKCEQ